MKIILSFALCCFGLVLLFAVPGFFSEAPNQQTQVFLATLHPPKTPQEQAPQTLTLLFVGDIMLDRGIEWGVQKYGKGEWTWPFQPIAQTLQETDLLFGNLESQISDKGVNVGSIYSFRADPKSIEALQYAGFDVVSVANNHNFDYTREAFEDSRARLREAGIAPVADERAVKEVRGTTIGFLAYSNFPGPAQATWNNLDQLAQEIARAKTSVDILAVSLHAGQEYAPLPNEFQKAFAKAVIDAGADLFIGHHPHVLQPLEQYRHGWIAYSLGNFLFDQQFSEETKKGAILKVLVQDKKIQQAALLPTRLNSSYQVFLDE